MPRGGYREGAGRKKDSGQYQEQTKPVRLPLKHIETVKKFLASLYENEEDFLLSSSSNAISNSFSLPMFSSSVSAGFPSHADDYVEESINLNEYLVEDPQSTFCVRVNGDSMMDVGIHHKDILVVNRLIKAKSQDVVIASLNGELTVKRFIQKENQIFLKPENSSYPVIEVISSDDFNLMGVVTSVIKRFR